MTKYWGGKKKLAPEIAAVVESLAEKVFPRGEQPAFYWEPMCGMYSVGFELIKRDKIHPPAFLASDRNKALINFFQALQNKSFHIPDPETSVTYPNYLQLKATKQLFTPLHVFVGHACGFHGGYFFGRLDETTFQTMYRRGFSAMQKILPSLATVCFFEKDFMTVPVLPEKKGILYCDPPYKCSKMHNGVSSVLFPQFDRNRFWQLATKWALLGNLVLVSETEAPVDWVPIWHKHLGQAIAGHSRKGRDEKLFIHATFSRCFSVSLCFPPSPRKRKQKRKHIDAKTVCTALKLDGTQCTRTCKYATMCWQHAISERESERE